MATFNVLGYHDKFTELYVCYCYELNVVGAGSNRKSALRNLADTIDTSVAHARRGLAVQISSSRRQDIECMFREVVFGGLKAVCREKTSTRHILEVYHFQLDRLMLPQTHDQAEPLLESTDKFPLLEEPTRIEEEDIPF